MKKLAIAALAAALALPAVPAMAASPELIAAAQAEGRVVYYTTGIVNQTVRPLAEAFEAKYGVVVEYVPLLGTEMVLRLTNEARAGSPLADLWDSSAVFAPLRDAGLLEPYTPESASVYPSEMLSPDELWVPFALQFPTTAVNTDLVAPEDYPTTFEDLLDPKWTGKMAWTASPGANGPVGFIGNVLITMGEEEGMAYLEKLAAQDIANIAANQRVVLDQAIAGEYPLVLQIHLHHASISIAQGAPIKVTHLPTIVGNLSPVGLVKNGPHPNAARLLLDFLISDEGQQIYVNSGYIPTRPGVTPADPSLVPASGEFTPNYFDLDFYAENEPKWTKIYEDLFQ